MRERRTRQFAAVYDAVHATRDHPTAEEVHERVRRDLRRVSLGTVYRNLRKLARRRQVRLVQLADRATRYDARLEEHDHFVCEQCGRVTDLVRPRPTRTRFGVSSLRQAGYIVSRRALTLYGSCPKCSRRRSASAAGAARDTQA